MTVSVTFEEAIRKVAEAIAESPALQRATADVPQSTEIKSSG